ncbi:MAG: hypothetical protein NTW86_27325 [Candidatus Sumerlaeota bacterium]|nr:hypothetical protein [Candidatus Sumerlaeota bacterium]
MSQLLSELQVRGEMRDHALGQVFFATDRLGKTRYLLKRLKIAPAISEASARELAARFAEDASRLATIPHSPRFAPIRSAPEDHVAKAVLFEQPAGPTLGAFFENRINLIPDGFCIGPDGRTQCLDLEFANYEACERAFPGRLWPEDSRFLAPEQLAGHEGGPASQVFSLGVLLHLFARGRTPFDAPSPQAVRNLLLNSEARSIRGDRDDLPSDFVEAIDLALCRHPEGRPQSLEEFRVAAGLDKAERTDTPLVTMERGPGETRKERLWNVVRKRMSPAADGEPASLGPPPWLGKVAAGVAIGILALAAVLFFLLRK